MSKKEAKAKEKKEPGKTNGQRIAELQTELAEVKENVRKLADIMSRWMEKQQQLEKNLKWKGVEAARKAIEAQLENLNIRLTKLETESRKSVPVRF